MEYIFLKKESIALNGIDATHFDVGDTIEGSVVNKVSSTLLAYYLEHGILDTGEVLEILDDKEIIVEKKKKNSEEYMEAKSLNPVMENKAITNLENKSLEEIKEMLDEKNIIHHHRLGKEKLIKLLEENK